VSGLDFMSWETFDQNSDEIVAAVRLLVADSKRRRRFQLVTVYEKRTGEPGELLIEVLATSFGPVIVYSVAYGRPANQGSGVPFHTRQARDGRHIARLSGDASRPQVFDVASRAGANYSITRGDLIRLITEHVDPSTFRFIGDDEGALTFKRVARAG
jgi:hypothetical protein